MCKYININVIIIIGEEEVMILEVIEGYGKRREVWKGLEGRKRKGKMT